MYDNYLFNIISNISQLKFVIINIFCCDSKYYYLHKQFVSTVNTIHVPAPARTPDPTPATAPKPAPDPTLVTTL